MAAAAVGSAVVCVLVVVFWVRSERLRDLWYRYSYLPIPSPDDRRSTLRVASVRSHQGVIAVGYAIDPDVSWHARGSWWQHTVREGSVRPWPEPAVPDKFHSYVRLPGFAVDWPNVDWQYAVYVRYQWLFLTSATTPGVWFAAMLRKSRRRHPPGRCLRCGFDLRVVSPPQWCAVPPPNDR